jgi:hypothetical protein
MKNEINKIAKDTNYFLKKFINNKKVLILSMQWNTVYFPGEKN